MQIQKFTFNPFQENTYVLYDSTKQCVIIDPGCYTIEEKNKLKNWILGAGLTPVKLINTHAHIDHVLGNRFIADTFDLDLEMHKDDLEILKAVQVYGANWGIQAEASPEPKIFLNEGDVIQFGETTLN